MSLPVNEVTILSPVIDNPERFSVRYGGLVDALTNDYSLRVNLVDGHRNYDEGTGLLTATNLYVNNVGNATIGNTLSVAPEGVIRDLTMPALDEMPIYETDATFVNEPGLNQLLKRKHQTLALMPELHPLTAVMNDATESDEVIDTMRADRLIVKPVTGQRSAGVVTGTKAEIAKYLTQNTFDSPLMVQEFIDTSSGIEELGIEGVHNIRVLSVGGLAVFGVSREEAGVEFLKDDYYGRFFSPHALPDGMQRIISEVNQSLSQYGGDTSVIAIDLMRGINAAGEMKDYVCEVNRRPLRISRYDLLAKTQADPDGLVEAARQWDKSEAKLLATLVE